MLAGFQITMALGKKDHRIITTFSMFTSNESMPLKFVICDLIYDIL